MVSFPPLILSFHRPCAPQRPRWSLSHYFQNSLLKDLAQTIVHTILFPATSEFMRMFLIFKASPVELEKALSAALEYDIVISPSFISSAQKITFECIDNQLFVRLTQDSRTFPVFSQTSFFYGKTVLKFRPLKIMKVTSPMSSPSPPLHSF